jgi:lipopolysaccharide transport system ATP-binding protein
LGGTYFPITEFSEENGLRVAKLVITFKAPFNNGRYFITLRLDDRRSDENFFPLDKQVAAISFLISRPTTPYFSGACDLHITLNK